MAKITLPDIAAKFASQAALNSRFQTIETALNDGALWRENPEGEANEMKNILDMNLNKIINLPVATGPGEPVTFGQVLTIINDINQGGDGTVGSYYYSQEFITLSAGQTVVSFSSDTTLSNFSISGLRTDTGKLFEGYDYDIEHNTRTLTLYESYPEGTVITRYREGADTSLTPEDAAASAAAAKDWAIYDEDVAVPVGSGGNGSDQYSALHYAAKAEDFANAAETASLTVGAMEGIGTYTDVSGAVVLDAVNGSKSVFVVTPNGDITSLSVSNIPSTAGEAYGFTLIVVSDGASTITYGAQFTFVADTAPTLSTTAGQRDYIIGITVDNGTNIDAALTLAAIG